MWTTQHYFENITLKEANEEYERANKRANAHNKDDSQNSALQHPVLNNVSD